MTKVRKTLLLRGSSYLLLVTLRLDWKPEKHRQRLPTFSHSRKVPLNNCSSAANSTVNYRDVNKTLAKSSRSLLSFIKCWCLEAQKLLSTRCSTSDKTLSNAITTTCWSWKSSRGQLYRQKMPTFMIAHSLTFRSTKKKVLEGRKRKDAKHNKAMGRREHQQTQIFMACSEFENQIFFCSPVENNHINVS